MESRLRSDADRMEAALVALDREAIRAMGLDPDTVVEALLTDAFVAANTDFPDRAAFLDHAGVESVWAFERWLDWILDWHVLGNTRFWSWEWLVHAAVALGADAARVGAVRCSACGSAVVPTTGSAIEEPGRTDAAWVEYRCACGESGRATVREPDGGVTLDGLSWAESESLPAVREREE